MGLNRLRFRTARTSEVVDSPPMRFAVLCSFLVSTVAHVSTAAHAQVPLLDGFGGTAGYGTQCLGPNDDGSSMLVDLSPIFPSGVVFFDRTHTAMYVNTNGNITFSESLPQYTPSAFPVANQPMIAPFWADVDIRFDPDDCEDNDGGSGFAGACHNPSSNGVWWHLDTDARRAVITWDRVGYYDCNVDKVMSFQLVLTPAPTGACGTEGDFDVEFRFNQCEWNTGDASGGEGGLSPGGAMRSVPCILGICPEPGMPCTGGMCTITSTPGQSGFDAGNETDFVEIMGSRTNDIHTILCTDSNVGEPGIWRFQIRRGVVVCPDAGDACDTGMPGACGTGLTQCVGGGTVCRQETTPTEERCDVVDNDCDGSVDEGEICGIGEVCDRGRCVLSCFEGSCTSGEVCDATNRCVDELCVGVTCPADERCVLGECIGGCDGVFCPTPLTCRNGQCVDLCSGADCDECTTCVDGVCQIRCSPGTCPSGQECNPDGRCVDEGCAALTCPAGETCVAGACTDACFGAICPAGQVCTTGVCHDEGTEPPRPDGSVPQDGSTDVDAAGVDAGTGPGRSDGGCGCRTVGANPGSLAIPLLLLFLGSRRRRTVRCTTTDLQAGIEWWGRS